MVAPYTGAWIETISFGVRSTFLVSLPTRGRGLKLKRAVLWKNSSEVAPYTGAWIETTISRVALSETTSLPTRGRGLKLKVGMGLKANPESLPTRGRGLKHQTNQQTYQSRSRSLHGGVD